jgi:hypothetical protein
VILRVLWALSPSYRRWCFAVVRTNRVAATMRMLLASRDYSDAEALGFRDDALLGLASQLEEMPRVAG